jgi:hypothetical protein
MHAGRATSTSPFPIFLDRLTIAECSHLADHSERQRLFQRELYRPSSFLKPAQIIIEGFDRRWGGIKAYVVLRYEKDGIPHFRLSVAPGAASRIAARICRNFALASLGAALMYSVVVLGRAFFGAIVGTTYSARLSNR